MTQWDYAEPCNTHRRNPLNNGLGKLKTGHIFPGAVIRPRENPKKYPHTVVHNVPFDF